jgi:L-phenylalanine/L-methionine N-acetyltransferase
MSVEVMIRPTRPEDAEGIYALRLQPSVIDGTLQIPSLRFPDVRQRIESMGPDVHSFVAVVVGQVVGNAGLHVGSGKMRHTASIGMMVHDRFQGQGIGRMLLAALLDIADNYLGLVRVELEVYPDNERAIRLYERSGFQHEGCKRKAVWRHGEHQDVLVMGRIREPHAVAGRSLAGGASSAPTRQQGGSGFVREGSGDE